MYPPFLEEEFGSQGRFCFRFFAGNSVLILSYTALLVLFVLFCSVCFCVINLNISEGFEIS